MLKEIFFPSLMLFGPSFLYTSHCYYSDYSDYTHTVTSQIMKFLCLVYMEIPGDVTLSLSFSNPS